MVSNQQENLFDDITPMKDDDIPNGAWPETLAQLIDVFTSTLEREHKLSREQAAQQARNLARQLAKFFGGNQFYLPKGERLERAIRDNAIWQAFNGHNIDQLVNRFRLTHQQIYTIVERQRKLHIEKLQSSFPFDAGQ